MMNIQKQPLAISDSNVYPWQERFYGIPACGDSLVA